jgi:tetratricopeptide (TPR) repeat protein
LISVANKTFLQILEWTRAVLLVGSTFLSPISARAEKSLITPPSTQSLAVAPANEIRPPAADADHGPRGVSSADEAPKSGASSEAQGAAAGPVNSALVQSSEMIASSNLLTPGHRLADSGAHYQLRLELARRQRLERDVVQAVRHLLELLASDAPEEIKKTALLELALAAQQENELPKAQQLFNDYLKKFPKDPSLPEVLLRQGLLYRQMGAPTLALSKFYAVMSTAMALKLDNLDTYQRLVLQAQTEIADTYYLQAKYAEAADFFRRLLKLELPALNKPGIQFKLVRCLDSLGQYAESTAQAEDFLNRYPDEGVEPEIRFLLATALKQLGRKNDSLQQVILLLQSQQPAIKSRPETWIYWQQRTGNQIANQLYNEGDYMHALEIYLDLADLREALNWQVPIWYQIGLTFERLQQPRKASENYTRILARETEIATNSSAGLKAVLDMARWRKDFLSWQGQAGQMVRSVAVNQAHAKPTAK